MSRGQRYTFHPGKNPLSRDRKRRKNSLSRRLAAECLEERRMLYGLSTGSGDGSLNIAVDGYGSFGSAVGGTQAGEAIYDPVGPIQAASTTFESGVAIRFGTSGARQFLTSGNIGSSTSLGDVAISGTSTSANSTFTYNTLNFQLLQTVAPMSNSSGVQTGSVLGQSYEITNTSSGPVEFELVRYLDGDLLFDGSLVDGGGRTTLANSEFLFETDAGGTGTTSTTFVGIDTSGGTVEASDRYEIDAYPLLEERVIAGNPLANHITGDNNGDGFVDAGQEYDVTLAFRTVYTLAAGQSAFYSTRTVFGSGNPGDVNIAIPTVSAPDVAQLEGDSGTTPFVFPVTLSRAPLSPVTVVYATQDVTATAGVDYQPTSGTLTFLPDGGLTQLVTVEAFGDLTPEQDETFLLAFPEVTGGITDRPGAIGTIVNDDVELSINDISIVEGNSGTRNAVFTITAAGQTSRPVSVNYATVDVTTSGSSDYLPRGGTITMPAGTNSATVTVPIVGDTLSELTETFDVVLSNPVNARIAKGIGVGTILDDDALPLLYVNDVQITTDDAQALTAVFTVALDRPSGTTVTVAYTTVDGTAHAGTDYTAESNTLVFPIGVASLQVTVPVTTPSVYTANEGFYLQISNPSAAILGDPLGQATFVYSTPPVGNYIIDDGGPGFSQTTGWTTLTNTLAYQLDYTYHAAGNGSGHSDWTFTDLPLGSYQVFTKWIPFVNRATNAPYSIYDGPTPLATVRVNQQVMPAGDESDGVLWQPLGTWSTTTGMLNVRLNDNANGYVVGDAVRLVLNGIAPQQPEMNVDGFGVSIPTGDTLPADADGTSFGTVLATTDSSTETFMIRNNGNAPLHLDGAPRVAISGANPQDFRVVTQPASTVNPGESTTFTMIFHPMTTGLRQAEVSIANDDTDEHPYTFAIQGVGTNGDDGLGAGVLGGATTTSAIAPLHNSSLPMDVSGDGAVSAVDALILIQDLRAPALDGSANYYMDVNGDGAVSPLDLLTVVDYLKSAGPQSQATPTAQASAAVASPAASSASVAAASVVTANVVTGNVVTAAANGQTVALPAGLPASAVDQAMSQLSAATRTVAKAVSPPIVVTPIKKSTPASRVTPGLDSLDG